MCPATRAGPGGPAPSEMEASKTKQELPSLSQATIPLYLSRNKLRASSPPDWGKPAEEKALRQLQPLMSQSVCHSTHALA